MPSFYFCQEPETRAADSDVSFTGSTQIHIHMDNCCSESDAGSDYVGNLNCSELERTSSFEAWFSPGPGARFNADDIGSLQSNGGPLMVADPVFSLLLHHDASVDAAEVQKRPSISNQCSSSSSPEGCIKHVLLPRMRRTGCMIDGSLHNKPENSYSEDTIRVDTLVPIPPMQWLSVKVHTGPIRNTYRKPFGKYHVQRAESKIRTTTELLHSCEAWSEPRGTKHLSAAEINYLQQQPRQQLVAADCNMQAPERPAKKVSEIISPSRGNNTVSDSEAEKNSNANATQQVDVHNTSSGEGDEGNLQQHDEENVWFASAMEQLARMSPPWLPRPKHPLPNNQGMVSHDRVTV